jgi:hypothetical protein
MKNTTAGKNGNIKNREGDSGKQVINSKEVA